MRLRLQNKKLQALLYQVKGNKTWKELAETLKVKECVLKGLSNSTDSIDEHLFYRLDKQHEYEGYIVEKLPDYWGRIKGGKESSGTTKEVYFPDKSEKLAELIGILLGDGNINISKSKKATGYTTSIVGDSRKDKEYLINYVKPLVESLFKIKAKIKQHQTFNGLYIIIHSKSIVEFLRSMGLPNGDKIKNKVTIPDWISENESYLQKCLRGLVDTDGSIYELKPHWPGTWQICFTNRNLVLLNDFRRSMLKLGISCSNIYQKIGTPKVYITKKESLSKFYKEIGFSNPKHRNKIAPSSSGLIHNEGVQG